MLLSVVVLALLASVQGRAVNISNTWVLPEEGFPVFYRYFRDRISWYEADAVCQFHHANLVTVDTTAQYDAVRAYLKELDISSAVWVGLIRSNPDGDFTWTDYRGLSGEGYWSSAPDVRAAPLCAAADPAADYRWEARACGGPTVASFICELPVPQWALGNEGCMVRALPALTILYLPESAAVQLTADCGMADIKKVQCTGNVKREDLLKELSCTVEEDLSTANSISTGSNWPAGTNSTLIDLDITNDVTTDETLTTEHEIDINQPRNITATSLPLFIYSQIQYKTPIKAESLNKYNSVNKNINLGESQDNNLHSNFVPKTAEEDNVLTNDQLEKLEDERHKQHKMLHEEIARVGNVDNIFTQPTDHFIPPLVMAKAKISDDMTVLSLAEKHAQQLAEKQYSKQNLNNVAIDHYYSNRRGSSIEKVDKPLIATMEPTKVNENKQEILKYHSPKKYHIEKYNDVKSKTSKPTDFKLADAKKSILSSVTPASTTESTTKIMETVTTTAKMLKENVNKSDFGDDSEMDLTVILKPPLTSEEQPSFSGDVPKLETIQNIKFIEPTESSTQITETTSKTQTDIVSTKKTQLTENITMEHDIIKITIIDDTLNNSTVFEVTTKMPVFKDSVLSNTATPSSTTHPKELHSAENLAAVKHENITVSTVASKAVENDFTTTPVTQFTKLTTSFVTDNVTTVVPVCTSTETEITTDAVLTTDAQSDVNKTELNYTSPLKITASESVDNINMHNSAIPNIDKNGLNMSSAEYHEILNMTDHQQEEEEDTTDGDFQSPLLSGVMEPMHRPPRTRRPQQPNRNKFNPFRILG